MRHYVQITLIPNADIDQNFLWSKLFQQIHLGLVEMQNAQKQVPIGISFPEYHSITPKSISANSDIHSLHGDNKIGVLGGKLRLFAPDEELLTQFNAPHRLARLSDYVHCTRIREVPENLIGYAIYKRVQPKTNPERLARRYAKRHGLDADAAYHETVELRLESTEKPYKTLFRYCDMAPKRLSLPFIRLKSLSQGQDFCLWIEKAPMIAPVSGNFSCYGLSPTVTVPEF